MYIIIIMYMYMYMYLCLYSLVTYVILYIYDSSDCYTVYTLIIIV